MKVLTKVLSSALAVPILLGGAIVMAAPAQALTCAPGYYEAVAGNGAHFCAGRNDGGVSGGGSATVGNGASKVPGKAPGVVAGNGGFRPGPPPKAPVKKPAVPVTKVTHPVKAKPPVHKVVAKKPVVKAPAKVAPKKATIKK